MKWLLPILVISLYITYSTTGSQLARFSAGLITVVFIASNYRKRGHMRY